MKTAGETFLYSFLAALVVLFAGGLLGGAYSISLVTDYYMAVATSYFWQGFVIIVISSLLYAITNYLIGESLPNRLKSEANFLFLGIAFLFLSYVLTFNTTSYLVFPYVEMNGFLYTLVSMALLGPIASISSFLILDLYYTIRDKTKSGITFTGIAASIFSLGCPTCGALIYSVIGVSGGLSLLPLKGIEFKLLSLALLGYALYTIYRNTKISKKDLKLDVLSSPPPKEEKTSKNSLLDKIATASLILLLPALGFVQLQLNDISVELSNPSFSALSSSSGAPLADLSSVDVYSLSSTAETLVSVFPELKGASTEEEVISILLPGGTPEYSQALGGITFEDPVTSLQYLSRWYFSLKQEVQQNDPETWNRYLKLAAAPRGISCEFCCGVGPQGIDGQGNLRCGCSHNIALQALTLGLMEYTDYSDAQILREVMKWKTMFFPRNMVSLAVSLSGKDPSQIKSLPGMVGGC